MKIKYFLTLIFLLVLTSAGISQTSLLFYENFESGGGTFSLNSGGPGSNVGTNQWIVDTNYFGGGIYPNTTNEDSTYGGSINYAPYSSYLHIYDNLSGYYNDNYNPANASDQFAYMTSGICTTGLTNVTLNFFYLCQGSPTAYGQVYYSTNYGTSWTALPTQYNNKYKWQYATITNPAFNNVNNLQIGFRWQNNAGSGKDTSALGIDDVIITGDYSGSTKPDTGILINVTGTNTVCPGGFVELQYQMAYPLCDAQWNLSLSAEGGTFPGNNSEWTEYIGDSSGYWYIDLPSPLASGCYKFQMTRTSFPNITITDTACLIVQPCPTSITTKQPAVTLDTNPVCAGSTIDVPFLSDGTFNVYNIYYAELSDSAGNFTTSYDTIGSLISNQDYGGPPGTVSGAIPVNVPTGCHYYIRVVADTPTTIGSVYGPFCIQHCDVLTNNGSSIQACVWSCFKGPQGFNDTLYYKTHQFDKNLKYLPGNEFETQLINSQSFVAVNTGALGIVVDTTSSTMNIHVPCADSLTNVYGISPGLYYLRIIATGASNPDSAFGSLVHLTIGEPSDSLSMIVSPSGGSYCQGTDVDFYVYPNRYMVPPYNSTYTWWEAVPGSSPYQFSSEFDYNAIGLILNGTQTFQVICQEDNYGCLGPPVEASDSIHIISPPDVTLTGPTSVCLGDTGTFSVPFADSTYYKWTVYGNVHSDTANNVLKIKFDSVETVKVSISAQNTIITNTGACAGDSAYEFITVYNKPVPSVSVVPSGTVCSGTSIKLTASNLASGTTTYEWSNAKRTSSITVTPPDSTSYWVAVSNKGCTVNDTVKLSVTPTPTVSVTFCVGDTVIMNAHGAQNYNWSPAGGLTINDSIAEGIVSSIQTYTIIGTTGSCNDTTSVTVNPASKSDAVSSTVLVPGESVQLDVQGGYSWYWSPSSGLNSDSISNPIATPATTTVYTVVIKNSGGCTVTDTITVDLNTTCDIFVPDAFSPGNPTGHNTILYARSGCLVSLDFLVFDRWGNKVFESKSLDDGWDGTYLGQPMNMGTYVYYATGKTADGKTLTKKGNVTLVR